MTGKINRINELPQYIADRIAAGEVVDRPVSIVKELVENSIDAGASSIVVEIRNGGKTYIRVTDNGRGIAGDDAERAFKRHATSKIADVSDLDSIATLGFRGEALASIAAVSRTELVTRTAEERTGTYILIEGGRIAEHSEKGAPSGTTLIVRDLFYNTPARMKFLKSDSAESSRIVSFVSKMAMAYADIRVRMINNGNTLFSTPGKGDRLRAAATVYDVNLAKKLIGTEAEGEAGLKLEGYISPVDVTYPNRRNQIFFVNGRYVQSKILEKCVDDAYKKRMFDGRFPAAYLFLSVDPFLTDVNIHPNKKEIRFDDEKLISDFVSNALKAALSGREAVPEIVVKDGGSAAKSAQTPEKKKEKPADRFRQEELDIRRLLRERRAEKDRYMSGGSDPVPAAAEETAEYRSAGTSGTEKPKDREKINDPDRIPDDGTAGAKDRAVFAPERDEAGVRPFDISELEYVGTVFKEYIICSDSDAFYLIDQHAAHERVFYERLTDQFYSSEKAGQIILTPIIIETSFAASGTASEWMSFLIDIGFAVEEFGGKAFRITEIPAYMDISEAEIFVKDLTESTGRAGSFRDRKRAGKIITKACKSAVKANDSLSRAEIRQLLKDLSECRNPFSCPHGRPTVIRMTHKEIDRLFKR